MQDGPIRKAEMDSLLKEKKNQILLIRLFDFLFALMGLVVLSPLFLLIALLIKVDSKGPVFFRQVRIGQDQKPFQILKFRSMIEGAEQKGALVTASDDTRQTRLGKRLRRSKLDELPQLINVLKGEMALVGPRPEVPKYVAYYDDFGKQVLRVKPGVTDLASALFKNEAEIMARYEDRDRAYIEKIMPLKLRLNAFYIRNLSLWQSLKIIFQTLGLMTIQQSAIDIEKEIL